jgi:carbon-monoxide dehydrogenase medium subunit
MPGEFLLRFEIPTPEPRSGAHYVRFIPRHEMDIAVVGVGAAVVLDKSMNNFVSARVALGAVAPTPLFVDQVGKRLEGHGVSAEAIDAAAALAQAAARPISDMRGEADYRRHLVGVLTRRALEKAVERARSSGNGRDA